MSNILYKTEGNVSLPALESSSTSDAVLTWVKDESKYVILSQGSSKIKLDKTQLVELARVAHLIAQDLVMFK